MADGDLRLGRFLEHHCPAWTADDNNVPVLPPESSATGVTFRRWRCEFCGFDKVEE